jgi:hypothetical protein
METMAQLGTLDRKRVREIVHQLLDEARAQELADRRAEMRHPFFAPVDVRIDDTSHLSAFSREISPLGIGLLHNEPLAPETVTLRLRGPGGTTLAVQTQILWCRPCGEGWYLSGGRFLQLLEP